MKDNPSILFLKMKVVPDWPVPAFAKEPWKGLNLLALVPIDQGRFHDILKDYALLALENVSEKAAKWFKKRPGRMSLIWIKREDVEVIANCDVLPNIDGSAMFISSELTTKIKEEICAN